MSKNTLSGKNNSIPKEAWANTWKWLFNAKWGWIIAFIIGGAMGGIFAGVLGGLFGAIIAVVLLVGGAFIIHLFITPSRLRKENRSKFIKENANYFSRIFGNKQKRKYSETLELLKTMIQMENEATDSIAGNVEATPQEIIQLKKQFSEQAGVPLLPDSKALRIYLSGKAGKTINQTIKKLNLKIMGNKPTDNQIEFFIKTRSILDKTRFGMAAKLPSEYIEYSKKIEELKEEDLQDWMVFLLVIPSGFNSSYLWYCCQGMKRQQLFIKKANLSEQTKKMIFEFKSQRESAVNQLIEYAKQSIEKM